MTTIGPTLPPSFVIQPPPSTSSQLPPCQREPVEQQSVISEKDISLFSPLLRVEQTSLVIQWISDYNQTPKEQNKAKLLNVMNAFFDRRLLDGPTTREFCELARCEERSIVEECIRKLINEINTDLAPRQFHIAALDYFLRKSATSCLNPHLLVEAAVCLVKKIDPKTIHVAESTEPFIHDLFEALESALLRMIELRVERLHKEGLYLQFDTVLRELASNEFYPISFQAKIMQQNLYEIRNDETQWQRTKRATWSAFNGLVKIAGGVAGTDPSKILDGTMSVIDAIKTAFEIAGGIEEVWGALESLQQKQAKSWSVTLRNIQWPLFQAAVSNQSQEWDYAFHIIQKIYSKNPSQELLFGIVIFIKKVSQYGVPDARLKSIEWFLDIFQNKNAWGVADLMGKKEVPNAPREEILRSLLQLASDRAVVDLSDQAVSALRVLQANFSSKERSSGKEIINRMISDIDTAMQAIPPRHVPIDLFPVSSTLSRTIPDMEILAAMRSDMSELRVQIDRIAGAPLPEALEVLRQSIKQDEYRQVETNLLRVPTHCVPSRNLISRKDLSKPTWDIIREFLSSDKKVLVIYASGGSGKTVETQYLEQIHLDLYTQNKGEIIPHRIELTGLRDPIYHATEEGLKNKGFTDIQIEESKKLPGLIILDAVDEARFDGRQLTSVNPLYFTNRLYQWTQSKVIFSIRLDDATGGSAIDPKQFYPYMNENPHSARPDLLQEIFLCPFQKEQQHAYLNQYLLNAPQDWLDENAEWTTDRYFEIISQIVGAEELSEKPFTLRILAEVLPSLIRKATESHGGDFTPKALELTQDMVYEEFLTRWFSRQEMKLMGRTDIPEEMAREGISESAWAYCMMLAAKMRSTGLDGITKVIYRDFRGRINEEWVDYFGEEKQTRINLGMAPLKRVRHEYSFFHKHIRDFLAMRYAFLEDLYQAESEAEA